MDQSCFFHGSYLLLNHFTYHFMILPVSAKSSNTRRKSIVVRSRLFSFPLISLACKIKKSREPSTFWSLPWPSWLFFLGTCCFLIKHFFPCQAFKAKGGSHDLLSLTNNVARRYSTLNSRKGSPSPGTVKVARSVAGGSLVGETSQASKKNILH